MSSSQHALSMIRKTRLKFREYWSLVKAQPDGPPETYHCTYLVKWLNRSLSGFDGIVEGWKALFNLARPALLISFFGYESWNEHGKPGLNTESTRARNLKEED
ncbi:hypothetical protein PG997_010810 [Apiospora hydei]|uniref:Uncharacterized protein n=1 Tax=Apiospora hydei TaxID=1337664 RepID=A0ABR1VHB0_9PEZI